MNFSISRFPSVEHRRARRNGPLPKDRRTKAGVMRSIGSCFICHCTGVGCDRTGQGPCSRCCTRLSRMRPRLNLDCLAISLKENSVYFNVAYPNLMSFSLGVQDKEHSELGLETLCNDKKMFTACLDWMVLNIQNPSSLTIVSLATDMSKWISGSENMLNTDKLSLLCSPFFHNLSIRHFGNELIQSFRLLIWATVLLKTARIDLENPVHRILRARLESLINFYGQAVMSEVDKACNFRNLKAQSDEQRLTLFLILVGLCLIAPHAPVLDNSVDPNDAGKRLNVHIEGLAYIAAYVGHKCHLLKDGVDARALVAAAPKWWSKDENYQWHISPALSKQIEYSLTREPTRNSPPTSKASLQGDGLGLACNPQVRASARLLDHSEPIDSSVSTPVSSLKENLLSKHRKCTACGMTSTSCICDLFDFELASTSRAPEFSNQFALRSMEPNFRLAPVDRPSSDRSSAWTQQETSGPHDSIFSNISGSYNPHEFATSDYFWSCCQCLEHHLYVLSERCCHCQHDVCSNCLHSF